MSGRVCLYGGLQQVSGPCGKAVMSCKTNYGLTSTLRMSEGARQVLSTAWVRGNPWARERPIDMGETHGPGRDP